MHTDVNPYDYTSDRGKLSSMPSREQFETSLDIAKMKLLRVKAGLSMDDAARAAKFANRQRWYIIESGRKTNVTIETLSRIATAIGVKARDLLK